MIVKCERCQWQGEAQPKPYPSPDRQSRHYCSSGDECIDCPRCGRGYFKEDSGDYVADRVLTIVRR